VYKNVKRTAACNTNGSIVIACEDAFFVDLELVLFLISTIIYIFLIFLCNNDGSIGIACSSPLNIFIHVIPEDGPYGPKHVVKIIRA
jgi:hypothetical protein